MLYIVKGADETEVIHEIGHMVEKRMLDTRRARELRKKLVGEPSI